MSDDLRGFVFADGSWVYVVGAVDWSFHEGLAIEGFARPRSIPAIQATTHPLVSALLTLHELSRLAHTEARGCA